MPVPSPDSMLDLEWDDLPKLEIMSEDDSAGEEQDELLSSNNSKEDDLPGLDPLSNDEDEVNEPLENLFFSLGDDKSLYIEQITKVLTQCQPLPGDRKPLDPLYEEGNQRFIVGHQNQGLYCIYDQVQGFEADIHLSRVRWDFFSIGKWYAERCAMNSGLVDPTGLVHQWLLTKWWEDTIIGPSEGNQASHSPREEPEEDKSTMDLGGIQVNRNKYPTMQRNAAQVKGNPQILPKLIVVKLLVDGHPARALLDSGSLGDFMLSTLADQLAVKKSLLEVPWLYSWQSKDPDPRWTLQLLLSYNTKK